MNHLNLFHFITLLLFLIFASVSDVAAQMCIGATRYVVRDEAGKIMTEEKLKKLTVKNINGIPLKLIQIPSEMGSHYYEIGAYYYEAEIVRARYQKIVRETEIVLKNSNPLVFFDGLTHCGRIGDLTLEYGGKQMRLIFDIGGHNTSYEIDSLPFREGTFRLGSLKCSDGAKPPIIDNLNDGKCLVSAESWEGTNKDWVRHLILNDFWGDQVDPRLNCSDKKIDVINNQKDWAVAWKLNPLANNYSSIPAIDFRAEVVLIIYFLGRLGYDSIIVDEKGDLTIRASPRPRLRREDCSVVLARIYRSGVKSIEGKPLPPPSSQE